MPTPFTAQERDRITTALRTAGRRLFAEQGLRRTSLDALTSPAGIVKSTFYAFFDSKEALYLDLMREQMASVRRSVIDDALHQGADARDALHRFLHATVEVLSTDPLYRRLMDHPGEMAAVTEKVGSRDDVDLLGADNPATALRAWITEHRTDLIDEDPAVILGVLQGVLLLTAHRDRLGPHLDAVLDHTIAMVATGLTPAAPGRSPGSSPTKGSPS